MKKLLILSFSLFLLSCGGESKKEDKTKTDSVVKSTTAPKEEKVEPKTEEKPAAALETPLKATIKEIKRSEKSLSILLYIPVMLTHRSCMLTHPKVGIKRKNLS